MFGSWQTLMAGASLGVIAIAGTADAEPAVPGKLTAKVAMGSDYMFRGVSETSGGPAVMGSFGYEYEWFYGEVFANSIDYGDRGDTQTTLRMEYKAGIKPHLGPLDLDVGAIYYNFPDSPDALDQDFYEYFAGVSHTMGPVTFGGKFYYSPEFYMNSGKTQYYTGTVVVDMGHGIKVSGGYGYTNFENDVLGRDYADWNAGITANVEGFDLDLRYIDNNLPNFDNDNKAVFTVSKSL